MLPIAAVMLQIWPINILIGLPLIFGVSMCIYANIISDLTFHIPLEAVGWCTEVLPFLAQSLPVTSSFPPV